MKNAARCDGKCNVLRFEPAQDVLLHYGISSLIRFFAFPHLSMTKSM